MNTYELTRTMCLYQWPPSHSLLSAFFLFLSCTVSALQLISLSSLSSPCSHPSLLSSISPAIVTSDLRGSSTVESLNSPWCFVFFLSPSSFYHVAGTNKTGMYWTEQSFTANEKTTHRKEFYFVEMTFSQMLFWKSITFKHFFSVSINVI